MYAHMEIVDESRTWPYAGPEGYRAAFPGEAENWANIPEAIQVRHFADSNDQMYDEDMVVTDIYVPNDRIPVEECMDEFGEHDDHSQCVQVLQLMNSDDNYDDRDYSGWYGGERGYNDGLRWSDFV